MLSDIKTGDTPLIQGDKTSDTAFLARTITNQAHPGDRRRMAEGRYGTDDPRCR